MKINKYNIEELNDSSIVCYQCLKDADLRIDFGMYIVFLCDVCKEDLKELLNAK